MSDKGRREKGGRNIPPNNKMNNVTITDNFLGYLIANIFTPVQSRSYNTYNINTNYNNITGDSVKKFSGVNIYGDIIDFDGSSQGLLYDSNENVYCYGAKVANYKKDSIVENDTFVPFEIQWNKDPIVNVKDNNLLVSFSGLVSELTGSDEGTTIYAIALAPSDEYIFMYYDIPPTKIKNNDLLTFTFVVSVGGSCNVR